MKVDIRSTSMAEMERLEQLMRLALNRAVEDETMAAEMRSPAQKRPSGVSCEVVVIGSRPAGELPAGARILQVDTGGRRAAIQCGAGAAGIDGREHSALAGAGGDRHRRRRVGRRGTHFAGVVR
jgi:hypothetical protein